MNDINRHRLIVIIICSAIYVTSYCVLSHFQSYLQIHQAILRLNISATNYGSKDLGLKNGHNTLHSSANTTNLSFRRSRNDITAGFDIKQSDVLIFLHIQKTAGTTFETFLVRHLELDRPCKCTNGKWSCGCYRPGKIKKEHWLFSRFSVGWPCGVHADWTVLAVSNCVDNYLNKIDNMSIQRRYFYSTFLREPISRFLSEYRHVKRGEDWTKSIRMCNGRPASRAELPPCYNPERGWKGVKLDQFLSCPHNLAINRQTRMLADLTLVHCYNKSAMEPDSRDQMMLESAKRNLRQMAFFGLKEYMRESQELFEAAFGLKFSRSMAEFELNKAKSDHLQLHVTVEQMELIEKHNQLDIELYTFAQKLFWIDSLTDERKGMKKEGMTNNCCENRLDPSSMGICCFLSVNMSNKWGLLDKKFSKKWRASVISFRIED